MNENESNAFSLRELRKSKKGFIYFILLLLTSVTVGCSTTNKLQIKEKEISTNYLISQPVQKDGVVVAVRPFKIITTKKSIKNPIDFKNSDIKNYINQYSSIAISNMNTYGIPASIILAQGILESGAGKSYLATNAYNHFGIKCHGGWTGDYVFKDDDKPNECFRKYKEVADSFHDHAMFLVSSKRYSKLFTLSKKDYKGWARGLRKAGYATDPKYPEKLIGYIEMYHLYEYDNYTTMSL